MTKSYLHLINTAHSLARFADDPDPERLVAALGYASSGESVMIRAALSLIPRGWLPPAAQDLPLRLSDVSCDAGNCRALLEAIALEAGHPEVLG